MDPLRAIARPMLGAMFVYGGLDSLRRPEPKVARAQPVVEPLVDELDLPGTTQTWIRVNGAVQVAGGLALASGRVPRLAALALVATLVPTTLAGHRFWEEDDPQARAGQRIHFLKNVSMLGGLLLAADDTGGRESLPHKAQAALAERF